MNDFLRWVFIEANPNDIRLPFMTIFFILSLMFVIAMLFMLFSWKFVFMLIGFLVVTVFVMLTRSLYDQYKKDTDERD